MLEVDNTSSIIIVYYKLMGVYYRLPWFPQETTAKVIAVLNGILILLGIVHIAYGGVTAKYLSYFDDSYFLLTSFYTNMKAGLVPQIVFFIIGGVFQIITTLNYLGDFNHHRWTRVALGLIISEFAMNFTMAVLASMTATFNKTYYSDLYDNSDFYKNTYLNDYVQYMLGYYRFTIAQAVLTFVLGLPLIALTMVALLDYSLKQENLQVRGEPTNVEIRENNHNGHVKPIK